jgi:hypothetical protein
MQIDNWILLQGSFSWKTKCISRETTGSDARPFASAGCYSQPQASVKNERANLIHFNCHATNWAELLCRDNGKTATVRRWRGLLIRHRGCSISSRQSNACHAELQIPGAEVCDTTQRRKCLHVTEQGWNWKSSHPNQCMMSAQHKAKKNSVAWVRERTILTERLTLVGEVIANFCG